MWYQESRLWVHTRWLGYGRAQQWILVWYRWHQPAVSKGRPGHASEGLSGSRQVLGEERQQRKTMLHKSVQSQWRWRTRVGRYHYFHRWRSIHFASMTGIRYRNRMKEHTDDWPWAKNGDSHLVCVAAVSQPQQFITAAAPPHGSMYWWHN